MSRPRIATLRDLRARCADGPGGCWLWQGSMSRDGYGRLVRSGRGLFAHRLAWELMAGEPPPEGLQVRHRCDVRGCCNPEHLELGTAAENHGDRVRRGRTAFGEAHPQARLTKSKVRTIRRQRLRGVSLSSLATRYGVSKTAVGFADRGVTWRHV